ncbi:MAG: DUF3830 family protein [archaeon]
MVKSVVLSFPKENVKARAELLEELAPSTSDAVWNILPIKGKAIHDVWSGHIVFVFLEPTTYIDSENLSHGDVGPGDLFYYHRPAHYFRGAPYGKLEAAEIGVVYDRDSQPRGPRGVKLVNVFGRVVENLDGLKKIGEKMITQGSADFSIERV